MWFGVCEKNIFVDGLQLDPGENLQTSRGDKEGW